MSGVGSQWVKMHVHPFPFQVIVSTYRNGDKLDTII